MTQITERHHVDVQPQVGALLHYNSGIADPNAIRGSRDWLLDGSCALVDSRWVLSTTHVTGKPGRKAIFLPGFGIFSVRHWQQEPRRGRRPGDYMTLGQVERPLDDLDPLRTWKIKGECKQGSYAYVSGFGRWERAGKVEPDGLQQTRWVKIGQPERIHYDNLDINWWSPWNSDQAVGLNHSGGPVLWKTRSGFAVVGVMRERRFYQQISSWVGRRRYKWLRDVLDSRPAPRERRIVDSSEATLSPRGYVLYPVENVGPSLRLTASANARIELQAALFDHRPVQDEIASLRADRTAVGRFIVRECPCDLRPPDPAWVCIVGRRMSRPAAIQVVVTVSS
ncbi:MAG: hypothetical protein MJB57_00995 [Gemmatimonadetes bacterium]|nr:hypothetical protein [Gemmatimonadota bacterium]